MTIPRIVAHRGASHAAPDNTLEAFELAISEGADMVETDVRETADGVLVLYHDELLPDGRAIPNCSYEDVRAGGLGIVRFDELCIVAAGRIALDVELKTPGQERQVLATLDAHLPEWEATSVITSFLDAVVAEVRRLRPSARVGLLVEDVIAGAIERTRAAHADFLAPEDVLVDDSLLAEAERAAVPLVIWTVDDEERAAALAKHRSVESVITNRPSAVRRAVDSPRVSADDLPEPDPPAAAG